MEAGIHLLLRFLRRTRMGWDNVEFKLAQAERILERMQTASSQLEFYDALSQFLVAARSVPDVLRKQCLDMSQKQDRPAVKRWMEGATKVIRDHPLSKERDSDVHSAGVPSAKFLPKPGGPGFPISPGTALKPVRAIYKLADEIVIGLAFSGRRPEDFYFEFDPRKSALIVCREYLNLVKNLVESAKRQPW